MEDTKSFIIPAEYYKVLVDVITDYICGEQHHRELLQDNTMAHMRNSKCGKIKCDLLNSKDKPNTTIKHGYADELINLLDEYYPDKDWNGDRIKLQEIFILLEKHFGRKSNKQF